MIRRPLLLVASLLLLVPVGLTACDSGGDRRDFEDAAFETPEGITRTNDEGEVLENDPDDWRTSPLFPAVDVEPAFPNPVSSAYTGLVTIPVVAPFSDSVTGALNLFAFGPRGSSRLIDQIPAGTFPGAGEFRFSLQDLAFALEAPVGDPGLYRLFVQDSNGRLVSYGDFLIQ